MAHPLESFANVSRRLRTAMASPPPGVEAQLLMSPRPRTGWEPNVFPEGARQAAVLVLSYADPDGARLVLTQRRHDLPDHPGQVSLPGGEVEGDETLEQAALREAGEEVDLDVGRVEVLGRLTPLHVPVSNFVLHPIVAIAAARPELAPADAEVARILEPRLTTLARPDRQGLEQWRRLADAPWVPFFRVDDLIVWGATAMVLAEFMTALDAPPAPWPETPERPAGA
ncbi:MAG: CoA pyrophosphatase [Gammaproteobacteria bacterium]|nr:CoA pyrophosphatase [Gammaproteobacteria bacterium]